MDLDEANDWDLDEVDDWDLDEVDDWDLDEVDDWDLDEVDDWIWLGLIIEFWISMNGNSAAKIQKKLRFANFASRLKHHESTTYNIRTSRIHSTVKTCQPKGEYPATSSSIRVNVKMYILSRIALCTHRNVLCKYRNGMFSHRNAFLTILNVLDLYGS